MNSHKGCHRLTEVKFGNPYGYSCRFLMGMPMATHRLLLLKKEKVSLECKYWKSKMREAKQCKNELLHFISPNSTWVADYVSELTWQLFKSIKLSWKLKEVSVEIELRRKLIARGNSLLVTSYNAALLFCCPQRWSSITCVSIVQFESKF